MAHEPRPHGAFQQGAPASDEDAGVAAHTLKRLQALKEAGGLPGYKLVRELPDGGHVIALDQGGVVKTITVKPEHLEPERPEHNGLAQMHIPMLYSGHVVEPMPVAGGRVRIRLTEQTRRRIVKYKDGELGPAEIAYKRFTTDYHDDHWRFRPDNPGIFFRSQYTELHPSWWSGAIQGVVQVARGFGAQPTGPDDKAVPESERDEFSIPEPWAALVRAEIGNRRLPGYTGFPPASGQIAFRFDSEVSHGLTFGDDGVPWLVEVSERGVYVMPLPVIPATSTKAFRKWMESDGGPGDTELLALIDRFGGVPSGEGFPDSKELFEAWRKAGVVIKVCDAYSFYAAGNRPMWWSCGWSFSASGKEGFATCYSYDTMGVKVAHAFKLKLSVGKLKVTGELQDFGDLDQGTGKQLDAYMSALVKALGTGPEAVAVRFKLRNTPVEQIISRAMGGGGAADVDYWRNLECQPIAVCSGSVSNVGSGRIYAPGIPASHPKIKFPLPFAKLSHGCVDFDFSPADELPEGADSKIKCDTIMLGYYVGDQLKVVKYFRDPTSIPPTSIPYDAEDGCMLVGSWESSTSYTPTHIWGNFYTTDFDERELASANETRSVITAWAGGLSGPIVRQLAYFNVWFRIFRVRAYHSMVESWSKANASKAVAVCVPWGNRNALLHAQSVTPGESEHRVGDFATVGVMDTYSYMAASYMKNWRWLGTGDGKHPVQGSGDGLPFLVDEEAKNEFPCVVEGEHWLNEGEDVLWIEPRVMEWGWVPSNTDTKPTPPGEFPDPVHERTQVGEYKRPLHYSSGAISGKISDNWSVPYFAQSPDQYGDCAKVIAAENTCGLAEYSMVTEKNGSPTNLSWGKSILLNPGDVPRFIGVINE